MRRLLLDRVLSSAASASALALLLLALGAGCDIGVASGDDDDDDGDDTSDVGDTSGDTGDGDGEPPLPSPAIYKRGSLTPNFGLPNLSDQQRFFMPSAPSQGIVGTALTDTQNICNVAGFTPLDQVMARIENQISAERGKSVQIVSAVDEGRIEQVAWRANPTDVDCLEINGVRKCIVPLGGGTSTPGNTVAVVNGNNVEEIDVGVRPYRTACHPAGVCLVANLYSNYISVIDMVNERLLTRGGEPVEIPVDYYTSDILIAERNPGGEFDEDFYLFTANEWLGQVTRYDLRVELGGLDASVEDVVRTNPPSSGPESTPDLTITGVGSNPQRLTLSDQQNQVFIANGRGGEVAVIDNDDGKIKGYTSVGAPAVFAIKIDNAVFVSTTMADRGLLAADENQIPEDFEQGPTFDTGVDGNEVEVHQGALFDRTKGYNFEDIHNSIVSLNPTLSERNPFRQETFTDTNSAEENFAAAQKVLDATLPGDLQTDGQGNLFVVGEGNDRVQRLEVNGNGELVRNAGDTFETSFRPMASFVDTVRDELVVVTWGSGLLETFDLNNGNPLERVDLGYNGENDNGQVDASEYPCADLEIGEFAYINTEWSNNGFKSCVSCHRDELMGDGQGYSNGVTAPTTYHKVIPCWNQTTTDSYFWTGAFTNDSYMSLAYAAQTRTNCELILFGLTEGPGKPAAQRVGDPGNRVNGNDAICRPEPVDEATGLPANFADIAAEILVQKDNANTFITQTIQGLVNKQFVNNNDPGRPLVRVELSRLMDWWMVTLPRLPPNPLWYLNEAGEAGDEISDLIEEGRGLFTQAGCNKCHNPDNNRAPFTDNVSHGRGAEWTRDFVNRYRNDDRVNFVTAAEMLKADQNDRSIADRDEEINLHLAMDSFMPFAFDTEDALVFEDPLSFPQGSAEEDARLQAIIAVNLGDGERGHMPALPPFQVKMNTPSLRGVWWNPNYLHHSMAKTFREAVVGPGHPALRKDLTLLNGAHPDLGTDERGWAFNANGSVEAHGATADMNDQELKALEYYVFSIE